MTGLKSIGRFVARLFTGRENPYAYKDVLRQRGRHIRREAAAERPDAAIHAARLMMDELGAVDGKVIALYASVRHELDTAPLAESLRAGGARLALPVIAEEKAPLEFRAWSADVPLIPGPHAIPIPPVDEPTVSPDIIVVPFVAFDRKGHRIGAGAGYYDRTLEALRRERDILAIGYGYGAQEVDAVPAEPLDQPLNMIVTERGVIRVA